MFKVGRDTFGREFYTTKEMLELEARNLERIRALPSFQSTASTSSVNWLLDRVSEEQGRPFTAGQKAEVLHELTGTHWITFSLGDPGTAKTSTLKLVERFNDQVLRPYWQEHLSINPRLHRQGRPGTRPSHRKTRLHHPQVEQAGCIHDRNIVGKGKSTKMKCFTWINTILGNLKTAISGTSHAFDFEKYPHRYLGEYQYRFNHRFDLAAMLPRLIKAAARTGRRPEGWLRLVEDCRYQEKFCLG